MTLKNAALLALIGMVLLTIVTGVGFIVDYGRFSARGGSCDIARHLTHSCICQPESGGLILGISKEAELTMLTLVADNTRQGVCQVMVSTI